MMIINNRFRHIIVSFGFIALLTLSIQETLACSTILVGKDATHDGAVLMSSSCDGDIMGLIYVMPAQAFPAGTRLPMYWNIPRPQTQQEYLVNLRRGYDHVGHLPPIEETYRSIILGGNVENMTTGGMNEHGLSIAIEFLSAHPDLACQRGIVGPNSNHWTTSLIANALMRTRSAREAVQLIGVMVEQCGFLYYRAPHAGVALPIADDQEVWLMEVFGPGADWTPDSDKPGGVWCAQRIPDGELGCSANRSRIGQVDLTDHDTFMASKNIHSLAGELGLWQRGDPFVWRDVYGTSGSSYNSMREWRALSLAAPSLALQFTGDPNEDQYPFSVKPDQPFTVPRLMSLMRDGYEGTQFDVTEHPAFNPEGKKSPLARPWGPPELFDLLGVKTKRALCTPTSGYVFVAQLRSWLPDAFGNCLWFAYGPAYTSCFAPVYAGITDLPNAWDQAPDYTQIRRDQVAWNFRLVHSLANNLRYQDAIQDIRKVFEPAEAAFLEIQKRIEDRAASILREAGDKGLESFLNSYAEHSLKQLGHAYHELVDYLMFKYLVDHSEVAEPKLPAIASPIIPRAGTPEQRDASAQASQPSSNQEFK